MTSIPLIPLLILVCVLLYTHFASSTWIAIALLVLGEAVLMYFYKNKMCMLLSVPILWGLLILWYVMRKTSEYKLFFITTIVLFMMQSILIFFRNNNIVAANMGTETLKYFGIFSVFVVFLIYLYTINPGNVQDSMSKQSIGVVTGLVVSMFVLIVMSEAFGYYVENPVSSVPLRIVAGFAILCVVICIIVFVAKYIVGNFQLGGHFSTSTLVRNLMTITILSILVFLGAKMLNAYLEKNVVYHLVKSYYRLAVCETQHTTLTATEKMGLKFMILAFVVGLVYLLCVIFLVPAIEQWFYQRHSTVILNLPKSLSESSTVQSKRHTFAGASSFWFYIDSFAWNTRSSYNSHNSHNSHNSNNHGLQRIISFKGNPEIAYRAEDNTLHFLQIADPRVTLDNAKPYKTLFIMKGVKLQKWNNIVLNYNPNNVMDIFINGELLQSNIGLKVPYNFHNDFIELGDPNGIYGSIANIMEFDHPQTVVNISEIYRIFASYSAPILNY